MNSNRKSDRHLNPNAMKTAFVRARSVRLASASALLMIGVGGCGDNATVPQDAQFVNASAPASIGSQSRGMAELAAPAPPIAPPIAPQAGGAGAADSSATAPSSAMVAPSMVIRNGAVTIEVDSLELAIEAVRQVAKSVGGYVGNTSLMSMGRNVRSANIELKIPADRFEGVRTSLAPIGKIESESSTAMDVGEEFVDVTARQANAHRLEERLISLLATRTGKLEDVLAVERELARVREEIERYEGRLRYLKSNVATSTLVVTVHEKTPIVTDFGGENPIIRAFKDAWRVFIMFITFAISSLGVVIPAAVLVLVARWMWRQFRLSRPVSVKSKVDDTHSD